ncbi:STAS domain-containing protein [Streptomyces sp. NPDC005805]|uniref:STAS domain-containing protein n=1 Tax=Streptomyces sp. NPDC005805 TaxID=3157068 RepID=UPI003403AE27
MTSRPAAGHPHVDAEQPIVMRITGGLAPGDAPRLCEELTGRFRERLRDDGPAGPDAPPDAAGEPVPGPAPVLVDVAGLTRADLAAVEVLTRLQLTARRHGTRVHLTGAGAELRLLLGLMGLTGPAGLGEIARAGPPQ